MSKSRIAIWLHVVWSTKYREPLLDKKWRIDLFKYIQTVCKEHKIKLDFINGVEDHVHILLQLGATQNIGRIMKVIKGASAVWINKQGYMPDEFLFSWQNGYGAFSVSPDRVEIIRNYIRRQEAHHAKQKEDKFF